MSKRSSPSQLKSDVLESDVIESDVSSLSNTNGKNSSNAIMKLIGIENLEKYSEALQGSMSEEQYNKFFHGLTQ